MCSVDSGSSDHDQENVGVAKSFANMNRRASMNLNGEY